MSTPLYARICFRHEPRKFVTKRIMEIKCNLKDEDDLYIQPVDVYDFDKKKVYYAKYKCELNCQKKHAHSQYMECLIMFLAENEDMIAYIENKTRNRVPKIIDEIDDGRPRGKPSKKTDLNEKKQLDKMKKKVTSKRSQSVLQQLKRKTVLDKFADDSADEEEISEKQLKIEKMPTNFSLHHSQQPILDEDDHPKSDTQDIFYSDDSGSEVYPGDDDTTVKPTDHLNTENLEEDSIEAVANTQSISESHENDVLQTINCNNTFSLLNQAKKAAGSRSNNNCEETANKENVANNGPGNDRQNHHDSNSRNDATKNADPTSNVNNDAPGIELLNNPNNNPDNNVRNRQAHHAVNLPNETAPDNDLVTLINLKNYNAKGDAKKQIIAACEYYIGENSPGAADRRRRYQVTDGLIYLGEGISVTNLGFNVESKGSWNDFARWLAIEIWGERELLNCALQINRVHSPELPERSPRKQIDSTLLRLFISLFHDFTERRTDIPQNERVETLLNITVKLSLIIRDLRKLHKKNLARRLQT